VREREREREKREREREREIVHLQFSVEESAATVVCVNSSRGKAARFWPGSQRDTETGTNMREKERDAGRQSPGERKRSQQRIGEDS